MPLNPTENYLRDRQKCIQMNFVDTVATSDRYLKGPGGYGGDGYPMPSSGKILRLYCYDGTNVRTDATESSFNAGDRISVLAQYDQPYFQVTVMINGNPSNSYCNLVLANATLRVSVLLRLDVYLSLIHI